MGMAYPRPGKILRSCHEETNDPPDSQIGSMTVSTQPGRLENAWSITCCPGQELHPSEDSPDWMFTMLLSQILLVFLGINSEPSPIQSISVQSIQFSLARSNLLLILCHDQSMQSSRRG
jgi:hypothetical protein